MNQVVNDLAIKLIKTPLIFFFFVMGCFYVFYMVIIKNNVLRTDKNHVDDKEKDIFSNNACPKCGSKLVIREGKYGIFYGCSNFHKCKFTKDINQ